MLKVYKYWEDEGFETLLRKYPNIDLVQELHRKMTSTARLAPIWAEIWRPFEIVIDADHPGLTSDFPCLIGGPPIFSMRAWQILEPLIGAEVEALPVNHPRGQYFAIHVLSMVDALDREHSKIRWLAPKNQYISDVERHVWKPDAVQGHHMFKIPETAGIRIQLSEEFRRQAEINGLTGLQFKELK